jgi:hypothetical protein
MPMKNLGYVDPGALIGRSVRVSGSDQQKTFPISDLQERF